MDDRKYLEKNEMNFRERMKKGRNPRGGNQKRTAVAVGRTEKKNESDWTGPSTNEQWRNLCGSVFDRLRRSLTFGRADPSIRRRRRRRWRRRRRRRRRLLRRLPAEDRRPVLPGGRGPGVAQPVPALRRVPPTARHGPFLFRPPGQHLLQRRLLQVRMGFPNWWVVTPSGSWVSGREQKQSRNGKKETRMALLVKGFPQLVGRDPIGVVGIWEGRVQSGHRNETRTAIRVEGFP